MHCAHAWAYVYWNTYQLSSQFLSTPPEHTHSLFVDHMFLHSNKCRFLCNCSHRYCQCNLRRENTSSQPYNYGVIIIIISIEDIYKLYQYTLTSHYLCITVMFRSHQSVFQHISPHTFHQSDKHIEKLQQSQ